MWELILEELHCVFQPSKLCPGCSYSPNLTGDYIDGLI